MLGDHHLPAEPLEQFNRLDADPGVERVGELVGEEVDAAEPSRAGGAAPPPPPAAERRARQPRQRPRLSEAEHPLDDRRDPRRRHGQVVGPGGDRRPPEHRCRARHQSAPPRHAVGIVAVLLPLGLEPGHVHVRGALALAGLAGEAEIHHGRELRPRPGVGRRRIGERLAEHVGPGPGRVLLVERRHVARAHRSAGRRGFAALPHARALLRRPEDAAGLGEAKQRLVPRLNLARQDPQLRVHRRGVDDLAGIEDPLRIEGPLHAAEKRVALVAHHRPDELAP